MLVLMLCVFSKVIEIVKNAYWGEEPSHEVPSRNKRKKKS